MRDQLLASCGCEVAGAATRRSATGPPGEHRGVPPEQVVQSGRWILTTPTPADQTPRGLAIDAGQGSKSKVRRPPRRDGSSSSTSGRTWSGGMGGRPSADGRARRSPLGQQVVRVEAIWPNFHDIPRPPRGQAQAVAELGVDTPDAVRNWAGPVRCDGRPETPSTGTPVPGSGAPSGPGAATPRAVAPRMAPRRNRARG